MKNWRDILAVERQKGSNPPPYNLAVFHRGRFFHNCGAGEAETVLRAKALDAMLAGLPAAFDPRQRFVGGLESWTGDVLPEGTGDGDYRFFCGVDAGRGQRNFPVGFDHTTPDYRTLLAIGFQGYLERIAASRRRHSSPNSRAQLDAMEISLTAVVNYLERLSAELRPADAEAADRLGRIARRPPESFADALQLVWIMMVIFSAEGRYAMAIGRIDQYLIGFYRRDIDAGRLTRDQALDMLCHVWAKIDGLRQVTNICIGGVTPEGEDAVNELSYLCLEATGLVHTPSANLSARLGAQTPEKFHRACIDLIKTGIGFPALFNDEVNLAMLKRLRVPDEAARDYCLVGCVETLISGRQQAWSDGRFTLSTTAERIFERLGEFRDYRALWKALEEAIAEDIELYCRDYDRNLANYPPERYPDPLLSALTRDCIGRARDINAGGAEFKRYHGIGMTGLGTLVDSLAAIRKLVFEEKKISAAELLDAMHADFEGHEPLRQLLRNGAPKYGNDDPYVDTIACNLVALLGRLTLRHRTLDGGRFMACMASNIWNIYGGREVPATPDGRKAGTPLSDAASPYYGNDRNGPTAFVNSICKPDYRNMNCSVVNMRFQPEFFDGAEGEQRFLAFTREFVRLGGHEMQFNVTDNALLEEALKDPAAHRGLVVRVSGFSAYFVDLAPEVQQDIMRRRAHARA